jgi:hypothetical protein
MTSFNLEGLFFPVATSNTAGGWPSGEMSWTLSSGISKSTPRREQILIDLGADFSDCEMIRSSKLTRPLFLSVFAPAFLRSSTTDGLSILTPTSESILNELW